MEQLEFKLEVFEGPLDLLLHLLDKNKVDICDIPIAELLDQYMAYVEEYKNYNLDNISEFLLVASRLLYIKSKLLLPSEEEEEDPRLELVDMLEEYKKVKVAAGELGERKLKNGDLIFTKKQDKVKFDDTYKRTHNISILSRAYEEMFKIKQRKLPPPIESFSGIVGTKIVSVTSRVVSMLRRLIRGKYTSFKAFIYSQRSRSEVVAAFLAILELSKVKRIKLVDIEGAEGDFRIELAKGENDAD